MEKFILLPPGLQALIALAGSDDENVDGLPSGKHQLGGVHVSQTEDAIICMATNGKVAGIYKAALHSDVESASHQRE